MAFYYMLGAALFSLAALIASLLVVRSYRGRLDAYRAELASYVEQADREMKVVVASVTELTQRANRNTEALERSTTATAALTTRTERVEKASHHHADMDSFRKQKR